jgi:hypothetical protein
MATMPWVTCSCQDWSTWRRRIRTRALVSMRYLTDRGLPAGRSRTRRRLPWRAGPRSRRHAGRARNALVERPQTRGGKHPGRRPEVAGPIERTPGNQDCGGGGGIRYVAAGKEQRVRPGAEAAAGHHLQGHVECRPAALGSGRRADAAASQDSVAGEVMARRSAVSAGVSATSPDSSRGPQLQAR